MLLGRKFPNQRAHMLWVYWYLMLKLDVAIKKGLRKD
jgi:hypothetical protein